MKYAMLFRETPEELARRADPKQSDAYWGAWTAYVKAINEAGLVQNGAGLQGPDTATQLTIRGGARQVQDGPYPDVREQLGGFLVIDAPSLEVALDWAAKAPCASAGSVELRPLLSPPAEA